MTKSTLLVIAATFAAIGLGAWLLTRAESQPTPEQALPPSTPHITLTVTPPESDTTPETSTPTPSQPTQAQTEASAEPHSNDVDDHLGGNLTEEGEPARPADEAQAARYADYADQAVAFVTAYARPEGDDQDRWWAGVEPYLSADARESYRDVDPGMVPFTQVTGTAAVMPTEAPEHLLVPVHVPTDAGVWLVEFGTDEHGTHVLGISRVS